MIDRTSFTEYLASLDPELQRLLGNLSQQDIDTDYWIAALRAEIVTAASDGSVKLGCGTYAVVSKLESKR
eukprot:12770013-Ditylum_brightwellii.AAC.1